ncbi:unnamed protein product, partial [Vitrella brassicaformis CCMP3155]
VVSRYHIMSSSASSSPKKPSATTAILDTALMAKYTAAERQIMCLTVMAFLIPQGASAASTHSPNSPAVPAVPAIDPTIDIDWTDDEAWDTYLLRKKQRNYKMHRSGPLPPPPSPPSKGPEDDEEVWDTYLLMKKRQNAKGPRDPIKLLGPVPK